MARKLYNFIECDECGTFFCPQCLGAPPAAPHCDRCYAGPAELLPGWGVQGGVPVDWNGYGHDEVDPWDPRSQNAGMANLLIEDAARELPGDAPGSHVTRTRVNVAGVAPTLQWAYTEALRRGRGFWTQEGAEETCDECEQPAPEWRIQRPSWSVSGVHCPMCNWQHCGRCRETVTVAGETWTVCTHCAAKGTMDCTSCGRVARFERLKECAWCWRICCKWCGTVPDADTSQEPHLTGRATRTGLVCLRCNIGGGDPRHRPAGSARTSGEVVNFHDGHNPDVDKPFKSYQSTREKQAGVKVLREMNRARLKRGGAPWTRAGYVPTADEPGMQPMRRRITCEGEGYRGDAHGHSVVSARGPAWPWSEETDGGMPCYEGDRSSSARAAMMAEGLGLEEDGEAESGYSEPEQDTPTRYQIRQIRRIAKHAGPSPFATQADGNPATRPAFSTSGVQLWGTVIDMEVPLIRGRHGEQRILRTTHSDAGQRGQAAAAADSGLGAMDNNMQPTDLINAAWPDLQHLFGASQTAAASSSTLPAPITEGAEEDLAARKKH